MRYVKELRVRTLLAMKLLHYMAACALNKGNPRIAAAGDRVILSA